MEKAAQEFRISVDELKERMRAMFAGEEVLEENEDAKPKKKMSTALFDCYMLLSTSLLLLGVRCMPLQDLATKPESLAKLVHRASNGDFASKPGGWDGPPKDDEEVILRCTWGSPVFAAAPLSFRTLSTAALAKTSGKSLSSHTARVLRRCSTDTLAL